MSDVESLKAEIKKVSTQALNAKLALHDLSEELPLGWETIPEVAKNTFEQYKKLDQLREALKALG